MAEESKKAAVIRILQILWEKSDSEHPLTYERIGNILKTEYGIDIERKAIGRNLALLRKIGDFDIESGRRGTYLVARQFEDVELKYLIDAVRGSRNIPDNQAKDLIGKLAQLSNDYFSYPKNVVGGKHSGGASEFLFNIETLDKAIAEHKIVIFMNNRYGVDRKLKNADWQIVTPYVMLFNNQNYYLIGYNHYWKKMMSYRVDRLTQVGYFKNRRGKKHPKYYPMDLRNVAGYENGFDKNAIASLYPYMHLEKPETIVFRANETIISHLIDWFSESDFSVATDSANPSKVIVTLKANHTGMIYWILQYINEQVEVISPKSLRDDIRKVLADNLKIYSQ